MAAADAIIIILTKNWFDSKWCFAEFTQARALGKAIFPLIEAPTGETFVSPDIQHLDLLQDREGGLARLGKELTEIALNARGGFSWDSARPPYPGLLAFDEADAAIYFGRDDDIRRLIERLNSRRAQGGAKLVAVLGASGSGKSSLLRAGVLPRLKRDHRNWIALPPFRPQIRPLEELAQAVAAALGPGTDWRRRRDGFGAADLTQSLSELARDLRTVRGANEAQILITVDQAEELFGAAEKTEAEQLLRVLDAIQDDRLPFLAVIALRSDYLGQLQQAPGLSAPFEEFSLKPMPLARVRDIIEGPARVAGLTVDDALVAAAMKDAATDDALPLLAFALRELYDRFGQTKHLTLEAYQAMGNEAEHLSPLENAVRRKADEVLAATKPSTEDLQALRETFVPAMVRVNAEGEYARRPARLEVLPARARPLIERLAKARLLVIQKVGDATVVEVAHEALLRKWPLLRGWLDEEREFLIGKDQLEQDLRDWEKAPADQKTDALLSGLKLTRARAWLVERPQQLSETERKYIQASVERHDAEAKRREWVRRRVLQGSIAAAVVLAVALAGAVWQWRDARTQQAIAESRELAAQSQQALSQGSEVLAFREAVEAGEHWPTEEAEFALRNALNGPVERLILHHGSEVSKAAFSPDGRRIVTVTDGHRVRVWDAETGRLLVTLKIQTAALEDAEFSPDGKRIVTAGDDFTARVWDAATGRLLATLRHANIVWRASFSPDGKRIVTASWDHTARVWDAETGHLLAALTGHTGELTDAKFSPDGKRVVTASADGSARVWDAETGHLLATLAGHVGPVDDAAFSSDGKRIVTASWDHTVQVWDAASGRQLALLHMPAGPTRTAEFTGNMRSVEFSPGGQRVVAAADDGVTLVWNPDTRKEVVLPGHAGPVQDASFSPDGERVLIAGGEEKARIFDARTGRLLATLSAQSGPGWVGAAAFSPDGKRVVTASGDHTARVWDVNLGHPLATLNCNAGRANDAAFSPDGRRVAAACGDGGLRLWDAATGQLLRTLPGAGKGLLVATFSRDGKRIVAAGNDGARVWDARTGSLLATLMDHGGSPILDAAFSPDGSRIVTASDDKNIRVWDAKTGRLLNVFPAREWDPEEGQFLQSGAVVSAEFSPNGKSIVAADADGTALVFNSGTGNVGDLLMGQGKPVDDAAYSPGGKRVVTASGDGTAVVWDMVTGHLVAKLVGHTGPVRDSEFSPDGKRAVTASDDGTARLWDAETGQLLGVLAGASGAVIHATFSPDGRRILTASADGKVRIYIADFPDLLRWAKARLPIESGK